MIDFIQAAAFPLAIGLILVSAIAVAYFTGALRRMKHAKPEIFAASFMGTISLGFLIAFGAASAQVADIPFSVEGRGTTGEETIEVHINGSVETTIDFTTTTNTYTVMIPGNTNWGELSIIWPDGFASDGTNMDIDLFSFNLGGDARSMVAGDVQAQGQWVSGSGCTQSLQDPTGNRLHCSNGEVVFPYTPPANTTTTVPTPPTSTPTSTPTTQPASGAFVVINEIFYNPTDDDDGDAEFVELHNPGNTDIDLTGFTFDDSGSAASGETVTLSSVLPAGGYAILAPTGFDTAARWGVTPIATFDFGLSGGGELLTLSDAAGALVDSVDYDDGGQWPGTPDGDGPSLELVDPLSDNAFPSAWLASVGNPTPGASNSVVGSAPSSAVSNVVATPFEPNVNQNVIVTAVAQVGSANPTLYYRVNFDGEGSRTMRDNGQAPDATAGDGVYTASIPGQSAGDLIRYRIESGSNDYPTGDGRTYEGVVVDDPNEIPTGLVNFEWFIPEDDYDELRDNRRIRNPETIIEGSVLAIDGVVYDNMEVKIRGGNFARDHKDKQGLSFDFASGVDADVPQLVDYEIDEFALSAEWGNLLDRTWAGWAIMDAAGFPEVSAQHVRVQQNGDYYGLFRFTEKLDGAWRDGADIDGEFYKAVGQGFNRPENFEKKQPDNNDRTNINAFSNQLQNGASSSQTNYLFDNLDVPNVVNYLAAANLMGHFDSEGQNFYVHRDEPSGRWQIYPWDLTNTFGVSASFNGCGNTSNLWISCNDNPLWNVVEDTDELEEMVWRRMRTLLDGPMANGVLEADFAAYRALLSPAEINKDEDEWDDNPYRTNSNFNSSLDQRRNLFLNASDLPPSQPSAPDIVINEIAASLSNEPDWLELYNDGNQSVDLSDWEVDGFGPIPGGTVLLAGEYLILTDSVQEFDAAYPNVPNVVIAEIDGGLKGGGELIELITPTGTVVDSVEYSNVAPWPSDPADGDKTLSLFDHDDDNALAASWGISDDNGGTPGEANDTVGGTVAPPVAIVIHEIHYDPASGDDSEFIEFFNAEATAVDLGGFTLDQGVDITFPANTSIPAGGYLVITKNLADFQVAYPGVAALEWADGSLSNGGEDIQLVSASGIEVDVVDYDDEGGWPTEPDGGGPSLELIDPALDNADPASWKVSAAIGGSPGAANELVDVTDPFVVPLVPADGSVLAPVGSAVVSGTASDDLSGVDRVRVRIRRNTVSGFAFWDGFAWTSSARWNDAVLDVDGSWELVGVDLSVPGAYRVQFNVVDGAGNVATSAENARLDFSVSAPDVTDPFVVPLVPADGSVLAPVGSAVVSGTASDDLSGVDRVRVRVRRNLGTGFEYWDGAGWGGASRAVLTDLSSDGSWELAGVDLTSAGAYRVQAIGVDSAGNISTYRENARLDFSVSAPDVTDPFVVPLVPADGSVLAPVGSAVVSGTASDDLSGVDRVRVRIRRNTVSGFAFWDGFAWTSSARWNDAVLDVDGSWELVGVDLSVPGAYRVQFNVVDGAGNVATSAENPTLNFGVS